MLDVGADEVRHAVQLVGPGLFEVAQYLRATGTSVPQILR
jgi:hypothetical protein